MSDLRVECPIHGKCPAYLCCHHVLDGAKVAFEEKAREDFIGQRVCKQCAGRTDLTPADGKIVCAGCVYMSN